LLLSWRE